MSIPRVNLYGAHFPRVRARGTPTRSGRLGGAASGGRRRHFVFNDAMWLAELLAHGLIRASFVPDTQTQEMRNLLRTRKQLVREQSRHVLRVQKTFEDANINWIQCLPI